MARHAGTVDTSKVDLDDEGNADGLADQVEILKADLPGAVREAGEHRRWEGEPRVPRVSTGNRPPAQQTPSSSADRIAAALLGGR